MNFLFEMNYKLEAIFYCVHTQVNIENEFGG